MTGQAHTGRPSRLFRNLNAKIASIPMMLTAVVIFLGGTIWTVVTRQPFNQALDHGPARTLAR